MHHAIRVGDRVRVSYSTSKYFGHKGTIESFTPSFTNAMICKVNLDIGKTWLFYDFKLHRLGACVMETK